MNLEVDGAEGVHFTIPESEPLPTREQLTEMDAEFRALCPTGYEKIEGTIEGAEMYVPRDCYQYNGVRLSPIIMGYALDYRPVKKTDDDKDLPNGEWFVVPQASRGVRTSGFTEEEIRIIEGLAEKNKEFAFYQRE